MRNTEIKNSKVHGNHNLNRTVKKKQKAYTISPDKPPNEPDSAETTGEQIIREPLFMKQEHSISDSNIFLDYCSKYALKPTSASRIFVKRDWN